MPADRDRQHGGFKHSLAGMQALGMEDRRLPRAIGDTGLLKPDSPLGREIAELAQAIDASFAPQVTAVAGTPAPRAGVARAR